VNCVLPREKHGFESMALYINNVDYYQPDESKVLSLERMVVVTRGFKEIDVRLVDTIHMIVSSDNTLIH
jgi:hypothetical protein